MAWKFWKKNRKLSSRDLKAGKSTRYLYDGEIPNDPQEAYDKAVRQDDELFKGILKENQDSMVKAKETQRKQSVAKSKAASRNVTGKKPSQTEKDHPDDLKKHLAQTWDELNAEG